MVEIQWDNVTTVRLNTYGRQSMLQSHRTHTTGVRFEGDTISIGVLLGLFPHLYAGESE
jgi:hypothetical protein